jgi:nucleotide-binding universal stress UspA family protein
MPQIRSILVPVDFTVYSNRAVDYAAMLARQFGAKITLLHVIEQFTYSVTDTIQVVDHYAALKEIAQPLMDALKKKLHQQGLKVESLVLRGNPSLQIIEKTRKIHPDMIVMGTHGRTGIQHLVLGSVAERVVRMSACPVITVRGSEGRRAGRVRAKKRSS